MYKTTNIAHPPKEFFYMFRSIHIIITYNESPKPRIVQFPNFNLQQLFALSIHRESRMGSYNFLFSKTVFTKFTFLCIIYTLAMVAITPRLPSQYCTLAADRVCKVESTPEPIPCSRYTDRQPFFPIVSPRLRRTACCPRRQLSKLETTREIYKISVIIQHRFFRQW